MQYEFGFGLSYTTFEIGSSVSVQALSNNLTAILPTAKTIPGGNPHLWDKVYRISADVTNTGSVAGHAVPQLYLHLPQQSGQAKVPHSVLRGFEKVQLEAGQKKTVTFELTRRDISYWDVVRQQWVIVDGEVKAMVGLSSRDLQASASFTPLGH